MRFNSFSLLKYIGLWSGFFPHCWLESTPLKIHVDAVLFSILRNIYMYVAFISLPYQSK